MSIVPTTINGVEIDTAGILRSLKLNPADPKTQALILLCERYGLDPLLKHMVLVDGNPYVTRDGYLQIAHNSGKFDGIEVVDTGETQTHWTAKVAVWRKDMTRPVAYAGRYPKAGSNQKYGPEMAIKTAEVAALRRAFNVTGVGAADEQWDTDGHDSRPAVPQPAALEPGEPVAAADAIAGLVDRLNVLSGQARARFRHVYGDVRRLPLSDLSAAEQMVTELEQDDAAAHPVADPEPQPVRVKRERTVGEQLHIDAKGMFAGTEIDPEEALDVAVAYVTHGRTTSAKELAKKEADDVWQAMHDVRQQQRTLADYRTALDQAAAQ